MWVDRGSKTRAVVRRIARHRSAERPAWALLAATWVHLVGLTVAWLVPAAPAPEPPPSLTFVDLRVVVDEVVPQPPPPAEPAARPAPRLGDRPVQAPAPEVVVTSTLADEPPEPVGVVTAASTAAAPDVVDQLRAELGWAALDRDHLERVSVLSLVGGAAAGGWAGAPDPRAGRHVPASDLAGTPIGDYLASLERDIYGRWLQMDLDLHSRALGIQGDVTVRYRVRRNGVTSDIRVSRSSGLPGLDGMAVRAIPPRVARLPDTYDGESLSHEVTLRYRNP